MVTAVDLLTGAAALGAVPANGYVGKGTLVVRAPLPNTNIPIDVGGHVAFEERGSLFRLDVLDVALPGAGAVGSAVATQLFPPGGLTVVVDFAAKRYTVWSNTTRKYYTTNIAGNSTPSGAAATPSTSPSSAPNPFGFEKSLRTLAALNISLSLAGHSTVDGHPTTGLNYQFSRTAAGGDRTEAHGAIEFADDLDGLPVQLTASFQNKYVANISLRADATELTKQSPADADFAVPPGFIRASSVGDVVGRTLPSR